MSISVSSRSVLARRGPRGNPALAPSHNKGAPPPVATRLESENGPCDRSPSFCRSIPPTLHQMQECSWIGIQFLQWSPFNSRNNAGGQPARLTQLDYDHQRAELFKGNQRTAQIINLHHGAPLSAFAQRQRCQTFVAVP